MTGVGWTFPSIQNRRLRNAGGCEKLCELKKGPPLKVRMRRRMRRRRSGLRRR
jgi:hypothetical protein